MGSDGTSIGKILKDANIRKDYWYISFNDIIFDDESVKADITTYYNNIHKAVEKGLGLFLTGDFRHGKTLISSCILKQALKEGLTAYFVSMFDFIGYYGEFGEKGMQFKNFVRSVDILCIDDVGAESIKTRDYSFSLLDNLLAERFKPTIMTSNRSKEQLKDIYGEHLLEFIGDGKIKEFYIDSGKSMRHRIDWHKTLQSDERMEPVW